MCNDLSGLWEANNQISGNHRNWIFQNQTLRADLRIQGVICLFVLNYSFKLSTLLCIYAVVIMANQFLFIFDLWSISFHLSSLIFADYLLHSEYCASGMVSFKNHLQIFVPHKSYLINCKMVLIGFWSEKFWTLFTKNQPPNWFLKWEFWTLLTKSQPKAFKSCRTWVNRQHFLVHLKCC